METSFTTTIKKDKLVSYIEKDKSVINKRDC